LSARPQRAVERVVRPMTARDVSRVHAIERLSYRCPWPVALFHQEVAAKGYSHSFVAEVEGEVRGYAVTWVVMDEVHLMNIAVHPDHRRRGVGHDLMRRVIRLGREKGSRWVTLEVRESNYLARSFYAGYGFRVVGRRRGYYSDNGEDAVLMSLDLKRAAVDDRDPPP
jgi:ribosomal-protein-alanine N-acetyltransferase